MMDRCPICQLAAPAPFLRLLGIPVLCNVQYDDPESARACPRGDLQLACCRGCAHIWNLAFQADRVRYDPRYENSLFGSPRVQAYAEAVVRDLVARRDLAGGHAVEVGCGDGHFLRRVCEAAGCTGMGFDPALRRGQAGPKGTIQLVAGLLDPTATPPANLVCARHVLEHVSDPLGFLATLESVLAPGGVLLLEVPDAGWTFTGGGVWDLIYEHVSLFHAGSLRALLRRAGFGSVAIRSAFGGQVLVAEAQRGDGPVPAADGGAEMVQAADGFAAEHRRRIERARASLHSGSVGWGAGSKGVMFCNLVGGLDAMVDINPRKQGRFAAGSGVPIVAPEELVRLCPERVLVMNPFYLEEVRARLAALAVESLILPV